MCSSATIPSLPLTQRVSPLRTLAFRLQGDAQSQQQQSGSGWIDGGLRERSSGGGGFSGLSAEANGFVPSNFNPAGGVAGVGEIVGGGGMPTVSGNNASSQVFTCMYVFRRNRPYYIHPCMEYRFEPAGSRLLVRGGSVI